MEVKIRLTSRNAHVPTKGTTGLACFDLYPAKNTILNSWSRGSISTDLKFKIPDQFFGKIYSRSGQFLRERVTVEGGIIDSDFRGVLKVLMFNHSSVAYKIKVGQRIAQLCFFKEILVEFKNVEAFDEPEPQNRDRNADLVLLAIFDFFF